MSGEGKKGRKGRTRPVIAEDTDGKRTRFPSVSEAAETLGVGLPQITNACKDFTRFYVTGKDGGIYSFFYEDEAKLYEPIMAVRTDGKAEEFENVNIASDRLDIKKEKIVFCCEHYPDYWVKSGRNGGVYSFCYGEEYKPLNQNLA